MIFFTVKYNRMTFIEELYKKYPATEDSVKELGRLCELYSGGLEKSPEDYIIDLVRLRGFTSEVLNAIAPYFNYEIREYIS